MRVYPSKVEPVKDLPRAALATASSPPPSVLDASPFPFPIRASPAAPPEPPAAPAADRPLQTHVSWTPRSTFTDKVSVPPKAIDREVVDNRIACKLY